MCQYNWLTMTFRALCDLADWSVVSKEKKVEAVEDSPVPLSPKESIPVNVTPANMNLHYNIQIHLPETTNMAVYDAIFQSLKKHLL